LLAEQFRLRSPMRRASTSELPPAV
jgi:hypothetical protein